MYVSLLYLVSMGKTPTPEFITELLDIILKTFLLILNSCLVIAELLVLDLYLFFVLEDL